MTVRIHHPLDFSTAEAIAGLTEDLRGPVRVALRYTHLLLRDRGEPLTALQRQSLAIIDQQAELMARLIGDLSREAEVAARKAREQLPADSAPEESARPNPPAAPRILVAEDDPDTRSLLREVLGELYQVTEAADGGEALALLEKERFVVALVDVRLPVMDGFQLAERFQQRRQEGNDGGPLPAFIYLSGQSSPEAKVRGLSLGASDYVTKPFDNDELLARVARTVTAVLREESLRAEALTDALTGLANYRSLVLSLEREFERSRRYDQPFCFLTIDLDRLKKINDEQGHEAGNDAIRAVAQVLKDSVRSFEVVARQGGDEFGVLLPNTLPSEGARIAERLRAAVAACRCGGEPLSVSIGLAAREQRSELTLRELIQRSDEALYRAKRSGRGHVSA